MVVAVDVEEDGRVSDAKVIKSVPSLDDPSINAAKKWLFEPAKYKGKVIRSKAWIGFVYEPSLRTCFVREILETTKGRPLAEMELDTVFLICRS